MKIEIGKYTINSDSMNMWIDEKKESKKKDGTIGTTTVKVAGYSRTTEELLESFMNYKTRDSEAETVRKLLQDVKEIRDDIEKMIKSIKEE